MKSSLNEMVSFDDDDVIFLLNKWDTLLDDEKQHMLFERTKEKLHSNWKAVRPRRILKLSMSKVLSIY